MSSSMVASTRPPLRNPALRAAAASSSIGRLTGTVNRLSRLRRESSLSGRKREKRRLASRRRVLAADAASSALTPASPPTWTVTVPPKQAKDVVASELKTDWL